MGGGGGVRRGPGRGGKEDTPTPLTLLLLAACDGITQQETHGLHPAPSSTPLVSFFFALRI